MPVYTPLPLVDANVVQVVVPCGAYWSVQVLLLFASPVKAELTDIDVSVAPVEVKAPTCVPLFVVVWLIVNGFVPVTLPVESVKFADTV